MTSFAPSDFSIGTSRMRATTSTPEPAGKPMRMVIGCCGQACASAAPGSSSRRMILKSIFKLFYPAILARQAEPHAREDHRRAEEHHWIKGLGVEHRAHHRDERQAEVIHRYDHHRVRELHGARHAVMGGEAADADRRDPGQVY